MRRDLRDRLEVLKFDLMEGVVGAWLRALIHFCQLHRNQGG
jgi:hypothetical protein